MLPADFPRRFFNPLTSKHRAAYIYVLLSIETVLEQAKSIALPRTALLAELRRKLQRDNYALDVSDEEEYDEEPTDDFVQDNIAFTIRKFLLSEWIDADETGDYFTEAVFITIYGKKLTRFLKDLTKAEDQSGYVINTLSNLQQLYTMPDSGLVCIRNAFESTQNLLTNIEMVYSKIKKYYSLLLVNTKPEDLLKEHLFGYIQDVVDKVIYPIKVDDSVDRFKGPILDEIQKIESNTELLEQIVSYAVLAKRVPTNEDGWDQMLKMLNYIKHNFNDIESYVLQLDEKNQTYVRVTRQKLTYMLSMDTSTKGDVIAMLRDAKERPDEEWRKISNCIRLYDVAQIMDASFYTPRKRHVRPEFEDYHIEETGNAYGEDVSALIDDRVARYTVGGVNEFILNLLDSQESIGAQELPLNDDEDYLMAIFLAMNSTDRHRNYSYTATSDVINKGGYSIPEFTIKHKKVGKEDENR